MPDLPVESFREAAPYLRRPFTPNAVHFKVQSQTPKQDPKRGLVVGYIDARLVAERLNLVCPHLWSTRFEPFGERIDSGLVVCHLTIDDLTRSDVGEGQGQQKVKASYSDAFKRAAVHFGVGVSLYAMSQVWLETGKDLKQTTSGGKKYLSITDAGDKKLRRGYANWLAGGRGADFGEPLDHGDESGSIGGALEGDVVPEEEGGVDLSAERKQLGDLYVEHVKNNPEAKRALPVARFRAMVDGAETAEDFEKVAKKVKELV